MRANHSSIQQRPKTKLRTLANWIGDGFGENFEFPIESAIHKNVLAGKTGYYPEAVQTLFPDNEQLRAIGTESGVAELGMNCPHPQPFSPRRRELDLLFPLPKGEG